MISLDLADLVVIAGRTLDLDEAAVLERLDLAAATAALTQAAVALFDADEADRSRQCGQYEQGGPTEAAAAAAAGVALVRALALHRPFPRDETRVATAAGLQFLSVNGWRARLDPPETAAVVIEALANGQLSLGVAADWLAPRLSRTRPLDRLRESPRPGVVRAARRAVQRTHRLALPRPAAAARLRPARQRTRPAAGGVPPSRGWVSALIAIGIGGLALLTTACTGSLATDDAPGPVPLHHPVVRVSAPGR